MKRFIITAMGLLLLPVLSGAEVMYVQVAKARLLSKPTAFSKALASLEYRTKVEVLTKAGAFFEVKTAKGKGYISKGSLVTTQPKIAAKLSKNYVSQEEVALATKGFNEQVESEYRKKNTQLPYAELDKLEKETSCPDPMTTHQAFRKQGKLGEFQAGGAQ